MYPSKPGTADRLRRISPMSINLVIARLYRSGLLLPHLHPRISRRGTRGHDRHGLGSAIAKRLSVDGVGDRSVAARRGCVGAARKERELDEGAGEHLGGNRCCGGLFQAAGRGTTVAGDIVPVIAFLAFQGVHDLVSAPGEAAILSAGRIGQVAVLRTDVTRLAGVQAAVAAEEIGRTGRNEGDRRGCGGHHAEARLA